MELDTKKVMYEIRRYSGPYKVFGKHTGLFHPDALIFAWNCARRKKSVFGKPDEIYIRGYNTEGHLIGLTFLNAKRARAIVQYMYDNDGVIPDNWAELLGK